MRNLFAGKKTYVLSAFAVLIAAAELYGLDVVPNLDQTNALSALWAAIIAATIRSGSKSDAAAAATGAAPK